MSSIRITKKSDSWELPGEGTHQAALLSVTDKGLTQTKYGEKDYAELCFALDQNGSDGLPLILKVRCTKSLYTKSRLSEYVDALTGGMVIPEGVTVELSDLVHRNCLLIIKHNVSLKDGKRWANVVSALRLPEGTPALPLPMQQTAAQPAAQPVVQPVPNQWPNPQSANRWSAPSTPPPNSAPGSYVIGTNSTPGSISK